MSAAPRRLRWLALAAPLVLIVLAAVTWAPRSRWLEETTGEATLDEQARALVWLLRRRPIETADFVPAAHAGVVPYGVNTFFEQEVDEEKVRRSMAILQAAGVRWIRQEFPWDRIEIPEKGRYEDPYGGETWTTYDRIVRLAGEHGLEILARPDLPPVWARSNRSVPRGVPDDWEDYGDFLTALAERYRGQIHYWQIWNEPNLLHEWGDAPDPREYAAFLRMARERLKAVDGDAVIISASLAQTLGTEDGLNVSDLDYLEALYEAGAAPLFDILAANAYGLWTGPADPRIDREHTNVGRLLLVREIMVRHGDAAKAVWVSELGWNAVPPDFPGGRPHGQVTEDQQARYTVQLYRMAQERWPWVGAMFYWHFRRAYPENRAESDYYFRMLDVDFTPLPVFEAYSGLAMSPPVLGIGAHLPSHWALRWQGWRTDGQGRRVSERAGDRLSFRFSGTDLSLLVRGAGSLRVGMDGAPPYLVDAQPAGEVRLAQGLAPGAHSALIEARGPGLAIEQVVVRREMSPFWVRRFLGVLLGLGLSALVAAAAVRR